MTFFITYTILWDVLTGYVRPEADCFFEHTMQWLLFYHRIHIWHFCDKVHLSFFDFLVTYNAITFLMTATVYISMTFLQHSGTLSALSIMQFWKMFLLFCDNQYYVRLRHTIPWHLFFICLFQLYCNFPLSFCDVLHSDIFMKYYDIFIMTLTFIGCLKNSHASCAEAKESLSSER